MQSDILRLSNLSSTSTIDASAISLDSISQEALPTFVSRAKSNGVSPLLAIGGWSGSQYSSTAVATEGSWTVFVQAVLDLVNKYGLDSMDFEVYPISPNDSTNFPLFMQALRAKAPSNLILSAVGISPFNGNPMPDVSAFANVLDHVKTMTCEIWRSWSAGVGQIRLLRSKSGWFLYFGRERVNAWTNLDQCEVPC